MYFLWVVAAVGIVCVLAALQEFLKKDIVRAIVFALVAFICAAVFFSQRG